MTVPRLLGIKFCNIPYPKDRQPFGLSQHFLTLGLVAGYWQSIKLDIRKLHSLLPMAFMSSQ